MRDQILIGSPNAQSDQYLLGCAEKVTTMSLRQTWERVHKQLITLEFEVKSCYNILILKVRKPWEVSKIYFQIKYQRMPSLQSNVGIQ